MTPLSPQQTEELRDDYREKFGLPRRQPKPQPQPEKPPVHLEPPAKLSAEDERAMRIAAGPQSGPNWHVEWADSAFTPGFRFQYIALDVIPPEWSGLDDVLVAKGYRSREEPSQPSKTP